MKAHMLTSISQENSMGMTSFNIIEATAHLIVYAIDILHFAGVIYQS